MKFSLMQPLALLASMATFMAPAVSGERMFISTSLSSCQSVSSFSASLFNVVFTPNNNTISVNVVAKSTISGKVKFRVIASVYGYPIINNQVFDPCTIQGGAGLCPMHTGDITSSFNLDLPKDALDQIPGIGYEIPDLDATVHVEIFQPDSGTNVACLEASISNGKTVDLLGVKWATAVIAGLALISSAFVSGLGHSNTASHVASNALSLFGYFQGQAIIGLTAVRLPPIVTSWTQDFQWSMGIIRVGFMQDIFTWYQRATGGEPARLLDSLTNVSVHVQKKRSLGAVAAVGVDLFKRGLAMTPRALNNLAKRANIMSSDGSYVVYGIQRVAFRAKIESTNLFMTGLTFFCVFAILTMLCVALFKGICELFAKQKWMAADKFMEFRNGWLTVAKGIMFRMTLIGFPQVAILCLWEFTQVDSPAEVVLAVFFFLGMTMTLAWGASKVIRIARRSVAMHRNPAYILFSDPQALNKWGFLYVQFRASAYYFIVPVLVYTLVKAMLVAFAQHTPVAQAVGFVVLEIAALIGASVMRPWMDKSTNSFNIAICVINFLNSICLILFSNVFGLPLIVTGVTGVVLFVMNAVFALVLLIMIIVSTIIVFFRKNPDARYQVMADDRASFMKSQTQLNTTTELDALAATARGDKNGYKSHLDLDDDGVSMSSESLQKPRAEMSQSQSSFHQGHNPPRSPVNPSMPLFPANERRPESPFRNGSPSPYARSATSLHQQHQQQRAQNNSSPAGIHSQNNSTPWQRGAGYDN